VDIRAAALRHVHRNQSAHRSVITTSGTLRHTGTINHEGIPPQAIRILTRVLAATIPRHARLLRCEEVRQGDRSRSRRPTDQARAATQGKRVRRASTKFEPEVSRGGRSVAAIKHPDLANAIDRMYEAAAYPDLWPEALRSFANALGGFGGTIVGFGADEKLIKVRRSQPLMPWAGGPTTITGLSGARRSFERVESSFTRECFWTAEGSIGRGFRRIFECVPAQEFHRLRVCAGRDWRLCRAGDG
jgi:hypothetical protein